ncbi:MAG: efflux RND transporter permease subunit [Clostridia bacterium]|nr:efflux RND transporter permease subunit [Clostridia bacterium]
MLAKFSVKKPYTVIVGIILVIALGVISFQNMTTDLLPSMDLPYVIVYTSYVGATPERVESDVTRPLEAAFATLTDVNNISSTSSENLSLVVLEYANGADMNTALLEISSQIDQLEGDWDDSIGTPVVMKLNPDMLPVSIATVSLDGADLYELSDYVENTLVSKYEAVDGVARVTASGILTQQVDITIEQSRIDALNSAILREVDEELADVEDQLKDAQSQLSSGKSQLSRMRASTFAQIDEGLASIEAGSAQLPGAIEQLTAQRAELSAQLESAQAALAQLGGMVNMSEEEKAQLKQVAETLSALETQRDALQAQLDALDGEAPSDALLKQLEDAQKARQEQAELKAAQEKYIEDLMLLDAESLKATIAQLESDVVANEAELSDVRSQLESAINTRDAARREVDSLSAQIEALEKAQATAAPTDTPIPTDTFEPNATATPEAEASPAPSVEITAAPTMEAVVDATRAAETGEPTELLALLLGGSARAEGATLEELRAQLAAEQAILESAQADVDALSARHDALRETLNEQSAALQEAKDSLALLDGGEIAVQGRIEEAHKQIALCDARIAELDAEIAELTQAIEGNGDREALIAQIAALDAQIASIKESDAYKAYLLISDGGALEAQYAQAQSAVAQLEAGIASIDTMLDKLNQGVLPGGMIEGITEDTNLAEARQQLLDAREQAESAFAEASSALREGEDELAEAWNEFIENRDEALENAGIDGIITTQTVSAILGSQNLDLPAGYVSNSEDRYLVSVGTEFASLAELKQLKLMSLGLDSVDDIRLLDVASVEISDNSADLFTLVNGENGVMLSFEKQSTASTAEVAENITAESERLMAENPNLHVVEMMNQGDYIKLIIDSVLSNLLYGGILAIAILLLFLLDWRPTLIVAISIPTSVVVAFVCMYFSGITLNVMSLSGLALGVGMLVDNSIVSIENIYRLRDEEGLPILTASIRGVNQVAGALFASTLTTICVFLPVVFVEGMARDLFSDMGLTIAFSLLASLLVAMTVVPSASAALFKKSKPRKQRIFSKIQKGYTALLRGALRVRALVLLLALALLGFSVYQVKDMGISFMPSVNSEQMSASLSFKDENIGESEQQQIALTLMERAMDVEGVTDVALSGDGMSLMSSMGGGSSYSYYLLVAPENGRTNADIVADLNAAAAEWADGERVIFSAKESTMDMSAMAGSGISIDITGDDIDSLRAAATGVATLCARVDGAENIDDGSESAEPKLAITVDKELANDNSLSVAQVYQYVAQRLYGAVELTEATLDGQKYTIYVSEDRNNDLAPEDLMDMEIEVTSAGSTRQVRIGDIATVSEGESLASIRRANQKRTVSVSFDVADGYSANLVQRDLEALLETYQPPEGCEVGISGENETVMGYMSDLGTMLIIAILFIFLIMVAQFQSFKSPIIVLFTIPLAFTGGLLALILTGMDLSLVAMLGFLVLSGVVVNNGIVFIDSVNQLRIGGLSKREALVETGRVRLRPILMTALTTILGMSTMALGRGMGAEMMQPMAVVTIGGLSYATLMTLFVVPVLYDLFNGKNMKAREIEMMKEAAGMKREGFDDDTPALPGGGAASVKPEAAQATEPDTQPRTDPDMVKTPEPPRKSRRVKVKF